jgi:GntR family transcriptional regulator
MMPMSIDSESPVPVYLQVEQILRNRIQIGGLEPGSRLPSETALASHFGVSRSTVRRALDSLVKEGLVSKWPGKGSFVRTKEFTFAPTSLSFSAQMLAAGHRLKTRVLERQVIPAPIKAGGLLGLPEDAKVIYFRRLRMLEDDPVVISDAYLPYPQYDKITAEELERIGSLSHAMEWATGVHMVGSRDVMSVIHVGPEEAKVLDRPPDAAAISIIGLGYAASGAPARYTEAIYRHDRFEFVINNTVSALKLTHQYEIE